MSRAFVSDKQGLNGIVQGTAHDALVRHGWIRSVGGASPYLGLFARTGLSRAAIDAEVAAGRVTELPSARGCTYLVPEADYAIALAAGQRHGDAAQIQVAKKHLGVDDAEINALCDAIEAALRDGPADPRALKEALGERVRHLGDAGKKRGVTTTLPLGLGRLQSTGRIRRIPVDGRVDQQRFAYGLWSDSPLAAGTPDAATVATGLAARFLRWIGPATLAQFAWWSGLTKTAAKQALASVNAVPFGDEAVILPQDAASLKAFTAPKDPDVRLVGSLDNLAHLRREVASLLEPEDGAQLVEGSGFSMASAAAKPVSTVLDLPHHAVVDRGRLVGFWDYDPSEQRIVVRMLSSGVDATEAIARTERFVTEELGDARAFSLDSPETRGPRLAALQQ